VGKLEQTLSTITVQQKETQKYSKELTNKTDAFKLDLWKSNKLYEDLEELNSELKELQRKLEMSEQLLLLFANQFEPPDANKQLQQPGEMGTA
jgi:hypothetical protein